MGKFGNFELTAEQRRVQELKNQQRAALRAQFWKHMTDPKRHASGEGGHLFDPAVMRFQAMRVSYTEFFKPTGKSLFHGVALVLAPLFIISTLVYREREERENRYRNGEVSYRDRQFKFI